MEPFDRWTKIRRCFKRIQWLEDYHDLGDLFKGHLGCCRSTWVDEEPVSHLVFQPKLLNCVRSHVYLSRCPLKSPDGPAHAGCASGGTYGSSTTNRKSRSPSRPEWLRRRQSRPSCMDAVRGPFARNTTPNSAPYTTESCFVSSGHSARDQTIG